MTADIDAVLSRLRERPECRDAVEVIERLTAERDRLREAIEKHRERVYDYSGRGEAAPLALDHALWAALGESPVPDEPTARARRAVGESLSFEVVASRGDRTALWNESHGFGEWWPTAALVSVAPSTPPCECWEHNAAPSHPTGEERDR